MRSRNYSFRVLSSVLLALFVLVDTASPFIRFATEPEAFLFDPRFEKKTLPPADRTRARAVDVRHVALDLRFDWAKKQAFGTAAIAFASLAATDTLALDAAFMTIDSIRSENGAALKFVYDGGDRNDNLRIALGRVYAAGEAATVRIAYRTNYLNRFDPNNPGGVFGKGLKFSAPTANDPLKPREIWSIGDPESNRYWFPGFDAPGDLRTTELTATVDRNLTVISNGKLVETRNNADGTRTFHWKADAPYANFLTSVAVGEFIDVRQNSGGVELHNYGYPDEREAVAASVARLPEMVEFFSELTGAKYPYANYSQVFVQDHAGGNGNHAVSTITENMIDDDRTHADFFYLWDLTEAEMLAAQWFGNYLTAGDWRDVWLNKSFAHYFNGLFNEHRNGRDEFLLYQHSFDQSVYLSDWSAGVRRPVVPKKYDDASALTSDNYATVRGALVLNMLRRQLGEEKWRRAIRLYVKANGGKTVSTDDFRKAVEEAGGESMDWFFDQWLNKMGHPVFEVTKAYDAAKNELTLNVRQTQKLDPANEYPQTEFFQGRIEIEIDGRIEPVRLKPQAENVFTFRSLTEPKLVGFDYESTWIKELTFEKTTDELLYQLQNDRDILGRRTALDALGKIAGDAKTAVAERTKILAALRTVIAGEAYWRLRVAALTRLQNLLAADAKTFAPDATTVSTILAVVKKDRSWTRAAALRFLGATNDPKFADLYLAYLNDESDRVINTAAVALGKSKSPKAFDALARLVAKPSWKNQSLMSALAGLRELGDPRGFDIAVKALSDQRLRRWRLPTPPVWDLRVLAVETITALGRGTAAFPLVFERFKRALGEDDIEGAFNNAILIGKLGDPRGQQAFDLLREKYKNDDNARPAADQLEAGFKESLKK